jgi:hypothetical protein
MLHLHPSPTVAVESLNYSQKQNWFCISDKCNISDSGVIKYRDSTSKDVIH